MGALVFSRAGSIFVCSLGIAVTLVCEAASQGSPSRPLVSEAQFEAWQTELSNWGRWGKNDELGTLNLVTPAKRKQAVALVKEGLSISLAANADTVKGIDNPCPVEWSMITATASTALDRVAYPCIHGAGTTHLDSSAHIFFNGKM